MNEVERGAVEKLDAAIREYVKTVSAEEIDRPGPVTHWALVTGFLPDTEHHSTPHWVIAPDGQQDFISAGLLHVALNPTGDTDD